MAVKKIATIKRWTGLSTDTKPTAAASTGVPIGSTFYEYDTNLTWITYDSTNWVKYKYELGQLNSAVNKDMPWLTEFWGTEQLVAAIWESTIDGAGTEAFATAGGYMYYDIDTDAVGDNDVFINSLYRWQIRPGVYGDSNSMLERFTLEFEMQFVTAVASHDNTHFFAGLSSAKTNDITQQNLIGFNLVADALKGKTDKGGTEQTTDTIAATLTNWNKYKIEVGNASITFSVNGTAETALTTAAAQPDVAMYLVLGTRAEAGVAVGLNIGSIRTWYDETI